MATEKFIKTVSRVVPIQIEEIDTDQIIPARFLKATSKEGFGENLFRDWRYDKTNKPIAGFPLNDTKYSGTILVGGKNFGCGSSREHAAYWPLPKCDRRRSRAARYSWGSRPRGHVDVRSRCGRWCLTWRQLSSNGA